MQRLLRRRAPDAHLATRPPRRPGAAALWLLAPTVAALAAGTAIAGRNLPGAAAATPTRSADTDADFTIRPNTWAVVIGTNQGGTSRPNLQSAVADATEMNTALRRGGVARQHIRVVIGADVTAPAIRAAISWLVAHATPADNAVLFYAGHAAWLSPKTQAIVTADGNRITDTQLAAMLTRLQTRRAWIILASCYAGGFEELRAPGRIITAAADANHPAYENSNLGHSYLVDYLIRRALHDNIGHESVQQAFAGARAALARDDPGREPVQYAAPPPTRTRP